MKKIWLFISERRASFSFTIGSIAYGGYHYFNQQILIETKAYAVANNLFGFIGGKYFGLVFIVLGLLKLYGLIFDNPFLKLPIYFALLFLWIILGICFLVAFIDGNQNAGWVYSFIIAALSTSVLMTNTTVIKGER